MSEQIKHAKIRETIEQPDGSFIVDTKSYNERLSGHEIEIMQHFLTNGRHYLTDLIGHLGIIKEKPILSLNFKITMGKSHETNAYEPVKITRTYTISKANFNKR